MLNEKFKVAYAFSLVGKLGFYIALPFIVAVVAGKYMDRLIFSIHRVHPYNINYFFTFAFITIAGIFSVWNIRRLVMPLIDKKDFLKRLKGGREEEKDKKQM